MLKKALIELNPAAKINIVARNAGLSEVALYDINRSPQNHRVLLTTVEAIFRATKSMYGTGLTPDKYLKNLPFKFN